MQTHKKPLLGLYIHWPYCLSKCPYCDFSSTVCAPIDESALIKGYVRDLHTTPDTGSRPLHSIFFGGGTPSLMSPVFLETLLTHIRQKYTFAPDIEISLEANPDAIDMDKMYAFAALGVNRLSIGVQSLNETDLHLLGRRHTVQTALKTIENAQKVFPHINMDLIYARPGQTIHAWEKELKTALSLGLSHYSLYQLTIEEGTVFYKKKVEPAAEEISATLYELTDTFMNDAGTPAYEVSNYARPGQECRHNLLYWTGGDYIGIGPAAHGRIGNIASENERFATKWLKTPTKYEPLTNAERFVERVLMGLRLRHTPFPINGLDPHGLNFALKNEWITQTDDKIIPTLAGTLVLNELIARLVP